MVGKKMFLSDALVTYLILSLVIGLLTLREGVFCRMDVTLYELLPAMLLISFTTQPYWYFP